MRALFLVPVALMAVSPAAFSMDPSLRGFYVGGGVGKAEVKLEDDGNSFPDFKDDDTGYKLIVGYRIIDWVAVEANYANYGTQEDTFVLNTRLQTDFQATSLSALGMLPLGQFDLFGRLGVTRINGVLKVPRFNIRESEESTELLLGLGAQYRGTENLAIRVEWEAVDLNSSEDDDFDDDIEHDDWVSMLSLGFTYKF